jgi:multicomponent Na+:H+ antiporter subunit E
MTGRIGALIVTWIALWGELSVANLLSGVVVAFLIMFLFPSATDVRHRVHPVGAVKFLVLLLRDLLTSSWTVAVTVLRPTPERLVSKTVAVQLTTTSALVASLVANSLTLTPGTMTVAIDEDTFMLKVHVLGEIDEAEFTQQVRALEQRLHHAVSIITHDKKESL